MLRKAAPAAALSLGLVALAVVLLVGSNDDSVRLSEDGPVANAIHQIHRATKQLTGGAPHATQAKVQSKAHAAKKMAAKQAAMAPPPPSGGTLQELAKRLEPGVVQIEVVKAKHQWLSPEQPPTTEEVAGSGWFIDNAALDWELKDSKHLHVVTNAHVAIDAIRLSIRLPSTGLLAIPCSVVGLSPPDQHDIALLRVDDIEALEKDVKRKTGKSVDSFTRLPIGDSDSVTSGVELMALGYPEGLPGVKSTTGIMSGYQEMGNKLYLQMTTPINPGNSGGPLLAPDGSVMGMNTAGIPGSESIGFAIPTSIISTVLPILATHRVYERPLFGIVLESTATGMDELFGMDELPEKATGQYVSKVYKGSMAQEAGMKAGDVLYEVDGMPMSRRGQMFLKPIRTYVSLEGYLGRVKLNSAVKCKVWRDGKAHDISMKYAVTPELPIPLIVEGALHTQKYAIRGGLVFTPLTMNFVNQMTTPVTVQGNAVVPSTHMLKFKSYPGNKEGPKIVIADVLSSSAAEDTKVFDAAMVIDEVNHKKVRTMDELCKALDAPVKDHKGTDWLTIKDDQGAFSAMQIDAVDKSDKRMIKLGMIKAGRGLSCVAPAKPEEDKAKKVKHEAKLEAKAKAKTEAKPDDTVPEKEEMPHAPVTGKMPPLSGSNTEA
jgi:S1-C subfamily serine protease